jgi:hypothetical protein
MKEQRRYERFQLQLPARVEMDKSEKKEIFEIYTKNISSAGVLLLGTEGQFSEGTRCQLELIVSSEKIKELTGMQGLIKVEGTVVRSTPDGVAICFGDDCQILGLRG